MESEIGSSAGRLSIACARLAAKQQMGKTESAAQPRDRTFDLQAQASQGPDTPPTGTKLAVKTPPLDLHLSEDKLQKMLPLKAGAVVRLPIMLHSPQVSSEFKEDR